MAKRKAPASVLLDPIYDEYNGHHDSDKADHHPGDSLIPLSKLVNSRSTSR
jgi:hypothetical protein